MIFSTFPLPQTPQLLPKSTDMFAETKAFSDSTISSVSNKWFDMGMHVCVFIQRANTKKSIQIFILFYTLVVVFSILYRTGENVLIKWEWNESHGWEMRKYRIEYCTTHPQPKWHPYTVLYIERCKSKCESRKHKWTKAKGNLKAFMKNTGTTAKM